MEDHTQTRILVVDDNPSTVQLILSILDSAGFKRLEIAHNPDEAASALTLPSSGDTTRTTQDESPFDLVVADVILGERSGFDLCAKIKEQYPDTIVIMISGREIDSLDHAMLESGADDFLNKPFSISELLTRVELHLRRARKSGNYRHSSNFPSGSGGGHDYNIPHIGDHIDQFLITEVLGWGEYSVVYKVFDKNNGKYFAVKLFKHQALKSERLVRQFRHEIEIMMRIEHPNITNLYRMGNCDNCPFILMDYVGGVNLEQYLSRIGRLRLEVFAAVAVSTAKGLAGIHKIGVVHQDIKPGNILYDELCGTVKLADFGIARRIDEKGCPGNPDPIVGTPAYMAPEIFSGSPPNFASDIYSFGVTMYHFASGSPPFSARSASKLYDLHLKRTPKPIGRARNVIPEELEKLIVAECMAKSPANRPESMAVVSWRLEEILAAQSPPSLPAN